jgi:hypothetical protein
MTTFVGMRRDDKSRLGVDWLAGWMDGKEKGGFPILPSPIWVWVALRTGYTRGLVMVMIPRLPIRVAPIDVAGELGTGLCAVSPRTCSTLAGK